MYNVESKSGEVLRECVDVLDALALVRSLAHGWRVVRTSDGAILATYSAQESSVEAACPVVPRGRARNAA